VDFYFVPATDCASAALHWSLTLPILFRNATSFLAGQLSFRSVVQALLISGDPRKPRLACVGKFCGVCFHAVFNAASAGLNFSTFCLDIGRTGSK